MDKLKTMKMIIYKITNTINGKVYIGQTRNTFNDRYYDKDSEGVYRVYNTHLKAKEDGQCYNKHFQQMDLYKVQQLK